MEYIEPRDVTIRTAHFEMDGVIEGSLDGFKFHSTNSHFRYWFPSGEIDSLTVDEKALKEEQKEIIDSCKSKIKELIFQG